MATSVITPDQRQQVADYANLKRLPMPLSVPMFTPPPASPPPDAMPTGPSPLAMLPGPSTPTVTQAPPLAALPTQLDKDRTRLDYLRNSGSGISQIGENVDAQGNKTDAHPGFWKTLGKIGATVGDDALTLAAPNLARLIPGTTLNNQRLQGLQLGRVNQDQSSAQAAATLQDSQAQAAQRAALAQQEQAKAEALLHPKPGYGQFLYDKNGTPLGFQSPDGTYMGKEDPNLPHGVADILHSASRKEPINPFELWQSQNPKGSAEDYLKLAGENKIKPLEQQLLEAETAGDAPTANRIRNVMRESNPPSAGSTGTWTPGFDANKNPVMFNSKTGEVKPMSGEFKKDTASNAKIGSDEQKRADLAQNFNENIDQLENILTRRPDLFGPLAGRMTQAKVAFGTGDQDASTLMTLEHQLGMVAQGAHGMRSAQGVESAANSLVNGFKNSPGATRAALEAARKSVATFLNDAANPGQARSGTEAPPSGQTHSLATAMNLPFNKGKSADEVTADLISHGYKVVP